MEQDRDSGVTPYHSASLTRSSSLPVDGEDSLDQLRVMPLGSLDSETERGSDLTLRIDLNLLEDEVLIQSVIVSCSQVSP